MRATFETRRDLVLDRFAEMGVEVPTPKGAFYAMPKVPEGFVDACLDRGVIVVPGEAFGDGGAGHARLSYANDTESLREALDVMAAVVADLRA
jgi:aspartate aminotransferase